MSKKKAGGKTIQHIRPSGKRLGIKANDGQKVTPGMVLVRQRGLTVGLGKGVARGRDFTVYAIAKGKIKYGKKQGKKIVSVI
jgi:large subunit ribosomal protein L27